MDPSSVKGIKILSTVLIVVACLGFLTIGAQTTFINIALSLPDEKKLEAIQRDQLYEMDITTVEEFDNLMKKQAPFGSILGAISCLLILLLFVSAVFLRKRQNWARVSLVGLSAYYLIITVISVFSGVFAVSMVVTIILFGFTIYYLIHPTVSKIFQPSDIMD